MGMALDEPKENDLIIENEGFRVIAEKSLVNEMGGIEVAYRNVGFGGGFVIRGKSDFTGGCSC
jgi:Fe-S cluster assembly iron-binding protein IscA